MESIYLDHAATSPVYPEVVEAMLPYFTEHFGNPSSIHQFGRRARQAVDEARALIAKHIGALPSELTFTSGGTEADNLAIFGYALRHSDKGRHIITSQIEHHAVLHACEELERRGFEVTYLPVDETGQVSVRAVQEALREDTILVTLMFGNNEVGTIQPITEIGQLLAEHQAVFHTDAVQAFGLLDLKIGQLPVDMVSVSAHKINGPKGIGFLYTRENIVLTPTLYGGEQERKRRAGTENVAAIIGFAKAVELSLANFQGKAERYLGFSRIFFDTFTSEGIDFHVNGHQKDRLPHVLNVSFPGVNIEALLVNLDLAGIAASSGSACTAGSLEPSHVLVAMFGEGHERVMSAVRFSFGLGNTEAEAERAAQETAKIVKRLQQQEQFIL
ncbi:cysteine desulfurase family protein [Halalkalibacterium ligniniphilum]|uniref:cysteine desulfurase family protein n=1 Tax=Halalkalibacterium ligniniphilum TaxID=1134413 RepID=UPI00034663DA|nr:cysteine desulfurase family protein [Halalkalibacterium ligniniphilum]